MNRLRATYAVVLYYRHFNVRRATEPVEELLRVVSSEGLSLSTTGQSHFPAPFERLLAEIKDAYDHGRLDRAMARSRDAIAWGERHGDQAAIDRALCNRAGFRLAQGELEGIAREQQMILMRRSDPVNTYLAAYNLALVYDQRKQWAKSLFYARIALDHAQRLASDPYRARSHNLIANALVAQSYFREALDAYRQAQALVPPAPSPERALILANAGYCQLVGSDFDAGFSSLFTALRMIRHLGVETFERISRVRLSLCYGYIELGRFAHARRHGLAALRCGEQAADPELCGYALYLLGETEKQAGNAGRAVRYFERLQRERYPENPALPDLLMAAETHKLVNLMA